MDALKKQHTELLLSFIEAKNEAEMTHLLATVSTDGFIFDGAFFGRFVPNTTIQILERLLEWGFDKNHMLIGCVGLSTHGITLESLNFLLDAGADPNCVCSSGMSVFYDYCRYSSSTPEGVQLFLDHGANPKIPITGFMPVFEKLLEVGALIDSQGSKTGNTFLHHCCEDDMDMDVSQIRILLERGANPNIKNNKLETPLDVLRRELPKMKNTTAGAACIAIFYKHGCITLDWIRELPKNIILTELPFLFIEELHIQLDREALVLLEGGGGDVLRAKVDISPSSEKHTNPFTCPYHLLQECFEQRMKEMMALPQCEGARCPKMMNG